jgi:hypothetical protein
VELDGECFCLAGQIEDVVDLLPVEHGAAR